MVAWTFTNTTMSNTFSHEGKYYHEYTQHHRLAAGPLGNHTLRRCRGLARR